MFAFISLEIFSMQHLVETSSISVSYSKAINFFKVLLMIFKILIVLGCSENYKK